MLYREGNERLKIDKVAELRMGQTVMVDHQKSHNVRSISLERQRILLPQPQSRVFFSFLAQQKQNEYPFGETIHSLQNRFFCLLSVSSFLMLSTYFFPFSRTMFFLQASIACGVLLLLGSMCMCVCVCPIRKPFC